MKKHDPWLYYVCYVPATSLMPATSFKLYKPAGISIQRTALQKYNAKRVATNLPVLTCLPLHTTFRKTTWFPSNA